MSGGCSAVVQRKRQGSGVRRIAALSARHRRVGGKSRIALASLLGTLALSAGGAIGEEPRPAAAGPTRPVPQVETGRGLADAISALAAETGGATHGVAAAGASVTLGAQPVTPSPGLDRLVAVYERLRAEDLLYRERLAAVRRQLETAGIGGDILDRLSAAERSYTNHLDPATTRVDGALARWRQALRDERREQPTSHARAPAAEREKLEEELSAALLAAGSRLAPSEPSPRILRAASLPHRPFELAPRAPVTSPAVTPSYLDATDPDPSPADLAGTPESPLSEAIVTQAAALEHDPVAIFEFVRNEVATEWYSGAMKGSEETLRQRAGNDVDQAALLVALLRASSQPARFVHGVVELPLSLAAQSLGVAEGPQILLALARAGVPHRAVQRGGRLAAVEVEHTWVAARLPYGNYRGTVVDLSARTWVPLAPALEGFEGDVPDGLLREMAFDTAGFTRGYLSAPQTSDPLSQVRLRVQAWLAVHRPDATYSQQLGDRRVTPQLIGLAPSSMPVAVVAVVAEEPALDPARVQRIELVIRRGEGEDDSPILQHALPLWEVANRRVTLSYLPETVDDHQTIDLFGGLDAVPPYLVRLRPQLRIGGRLAAVGEGAADMASRQRLELRLVGPAGSVEVTQTLLVGSLQALGVGAQRFLTRPDDDSADPGDGEGSGARLLSQLAFAYGAAWDAADTELGSLLAVSGLRPTASVVFAGSEVAVTLVGELPVDLDWQGVTLDAALRLVDPIARDAVHQTNAARDFLRLSSLHGSALEQRVLEERLVVEAISADEGIGRARAAGIPVHQIDEGNLDAILPLLQHPVGVLAEIQDQARGGLVLEVPEREVRHRDWLGSAWRAEDPLTAAGGYFLAGGLAGGATVVEPQDWPVQSFVLDLMAPYAAEPNPDPLAAVRIVKVGGTDGQVGEVGELLPRELAVLVFDDVGRPVQGAEVRFESAAGGGLLGDARPSVTVPTDRLGMASVPLRLGTDTSVRPLHLLRDPTDGHPTRALLHEVEATAASRRGSLALDSPFTAVGMPAAFARLRRTDTDATEIVGTAGLWVDTIQVAAEDLHGNPLSNVELLFEVLRADTDEAGCRNHVPPNGRVNAVVALPSDVPDFASCVAPPTTPGCPTSECNAIRSQCLAQCSTITEGCLAQLQPCYDACPACAAGDEECETERAACTEACRSTLLTCYRQCDQVFASCPVTGCRESSVLAATSPSGAAAQVRMGTELDTTYSVRVSAPEHEGATPLVFVYPQFTFVAEGDLCLGPGSGEDPRLPSGGFFVTNGALIDSRGRNVTATHAGEPLARPLELTLLTFKNLPGQPLLTPTGEYATGHWAKVVGEVTATVSNGGSVATLTARPDHTYEATVRAGQLAGLHDVHFVAHPLTHWVDPVTGVLQPLDCPSCRREGTWSKFWGVDPSVTAVAPQPIELGAGGTFTSTVSVDYATQPPEYHSLSTDVELFDEDGVSTRIRAGSTTAGTGAAGFRPGDRGDAAQVVLNRGSIVEVRSPVTPLSLTSRLFPSFSPHVELRQDVDLANGRICRQPEVFHFSLARAARVEVTLRQIVDQEPGGEPALGAGQTLLLRDLTAGEHSIPLLPEEVFPGLYKLVLAGTDVQGNEEVVEGTAEVGFRASDALPLGHVLVQGVDLFDGSLVLSREDLAVPGRGVPLALSRTYATGASGAFGPLGAGWTHSYDSRIVATPCGELILQGGEGAGIRFVSDGAGGFVPLRGYHGTLAPDPASFGFDFYAKGGNRYHFEPSAPDEWMLDFVSDPNGNVTDLAYVPVLGGGRQLVSVTDPAGRALRFRWERRQFVTAQQDVVVRVEGPAGLSVTYEYDPWGNLARASREPHEDGRPSRRERYEYATSPDHTFEQRHLLLRAVDEVRGAATAYAYSSGSIALPTGGLVVHRDSVEELRRPEGGVWRFAPDYSGLAGGATELVTRVTDPRDEVTTYTLNRYGAPLAIGDPIGAVTRTAWDLEHVVMTSRTDPNGNTTVFAYDEHGNLLSEVITTHDVDGEPHVLTLTQTYWPPSAFDPPHIKDRLATRTDRAGHTASFAYDSHGNLLRGEITVEDPAGGAPTTLSTVHSHYPNGDLRTTTNPRGHTTVFAYDAAGNLASLADPRGGVTETTWDGRSRLVARTDSEGRTTRFAYDALGREVGRTLPGNPGEQPVVERTVFDDAAGTRTVIDAEGRATVSSLDREGRVVAVADAAGALKILNYDPAGNKTLESSWHDSLTPRVDTTFAYDPAGRLVQRDEPLGRHTTYEYDAAGNLLRETLRDAREPAFAPRVTEHDYDEANRRIRRRRLGSAVVATEGWKLDGEGRAVLLRDPLGRETTQRFDALGRLIETAEPEWRPGERKRTLFFYDGNGNRMRELRFNEPANQQRDWEYDELDRPIQRRDATGGTTVLAYDRVGNLVREVSPMLDAVDYGYDARDRRVSMTEHLTRVSDLGLVVTRYEHDRVGNLLAERLPNGNVRRHRYDALDRVAETTDSLGTIAAFGYDARGNRTRAVDANGNTTANSYDALGRLVRQDLPATRVVLREYDVAGNVVAETDPRGHTTRQVFDSLDRLVEMHDPAPHVGVRRFTYDLAGNKVEESDRRGHATSFEHDALDRLVAVVDPPLAAAGGSRLRTSFTYDALGNQRSETDRSGVLTERVYDAESRPIETHHANVLIESRQYDLGGSLRFSTDANGNVTGFEVDERGLVLAENRPLAAITTFRRDAMGDVVEEADPEGRRTRRVYDARRRLTEETNGAGERTLFELDGVGNRRARVRPNADGEHPLFRWEYDFDGANRLIAVRDPLGAETTYGYDGNGNRTSQRDALGRTTSFTFDELDRRTAMTYPDGALERYGYDAEGNLVSRVDPKGQSFATVYDEVGRAILETYPTPGGPGVDELTNIAYRHDANGNVVAVDETYTGPAGIRATRTSYDPFDRPEIVTDGFGKTLRYGYDAAGNRTTLTDADGLVTRYSYDALNRVSQVELAAGGGLAEYRYLRDGRVDAVLYPGGTRADHSYDLAGRVQTIVNRHGTEIVSSYVYRYDRNGNRLEQLEENGGPPETTLYEYDAADRLTEVAYPEAVLTYTYDAAGNRLTERRASNGGGVLLADKTYSYDVRDRLLSVGDAAAAAESASYDYDANGNQIARTRGGLETRFRFDARDQLVGVDEDLAEGGFRLVGRYLYDWQGLRVERRWTNSPADPTVQHRRYTYDEQSVLLEHGDDGATVAKYDHGSDRLLSLTHAVEGRSFYLFEALGTPTTILPSGGAVRERVHYDAWGSVRARTGASENPFGFTGHQLDDETDLYYARARFFDTALGRFLSEDPFAGAVDTPRSLHRYLYALGNPTVYVDPDGQIAVLRELKDLLEGASEEAPEATTGPFTGHVDRVAIRATNKALFGLGAKAVGLVNLAANSLLSRQAPASRLGLEAQTELVELGEKVETAVENAAQQIAEDPVGTVRKVVELPSNLARDAIVTINRLPYMSEREVTELTASGVEFGIEAYTGARLARLGRGNALAQSGAETSAAHGASVAVDQDYGIVYLRREIDAEIKPYVGQACTECRYTARQTEHARANPDFEFEFEILGRAEPGPALNRLEEDLIRLYGGPTTARNPSGGLSNRRYQMNEQRYRDAGGAVERPKTNGGN